MKAPFQPPKLPPCIDYVPLIRSIGKAHDAISELEGTLSNIPNPDLLTTPLLTKEAVLSSRIEGTQATVKDVFEYEASDRSEDDTLGVREVINYRVAAREGLRLLSDAPLSENVIRAIHRILMQDVRGHQRAPGEFRRVEVYVGQKDLPDQARYVPPLPHVIPELMSNLMVYINSEDEQDELVQIGIAHYQFEAIHPFRDGNGRIGRLLIPLMLYKQKRLSYPVIYISEFLERYKDEYHRLLHGVDEKQDWNAWLEFFLGGLTMQAHNTTITALKILQLYDDLKNRVATIGSRYGINLLDLIFKQPIFSSAYVKSRLGAKSETTVHQLLKEFIRLGILTEETGQKRGRRYVFSSLINLLR